MYVILGLNPYRKYIKVIAYFDYLSNRIRPNFSELITHFMIDLQSNIILVHDLHNISVIIHAKGYFKLIHRCS